MLATFIVFGLLKLLPGDVAVTLAGDNATDQRIEEIRRIYGLDRLFPRAIRGMAVEGGPRRSLAIHSVGRSRPRLHCALLSPYAADRRDGPLARPCRRRAARRVCRDASRSLRRQGGHGDRFRRHRHSEFLAGDDPRFAVRSEVEHFPGDRRPSPLLNRRRMQSGHAILPSLALGGWRHGGSGAAGARIAARHPVLAIRTDPAREGSEALDHSLASTASRMSQ